MQNQLPHQPNRSCAVTSSSFHLPIIYHHRQHGLRGRLSPCATDAAEDSGHQIAPTSIAPKWRQVVRRVANTDWHAARCTGYQRPSSPRGRDDIVASARGATRDEQRAACDLTLRLSAEVSPASICIGLPSSATANARSGCTADIAVWTQRVTAGRGRNASSTCAVTRAASARIRPSLLALRPASLGNAPCRHNDAFSTYRFYPLRLRQSRAPCQAPLAYPQMLLSAITPPGRTTCFATCHTALSYQSNQKENHRQPNLQSLNSAVPTAYRLVSARALVAHRYNLYLASMSQSRSLVLVTPQPTTVSWVDLNTYLFAVPSSKPSGTRSCRH